MIKGEIGLINEDGKVQLDSSLFEGIFVNNGNILFGIYYPRSKSIEYKKNVIEHDFMITPIPYVFWPTVTRIVIRMKHNVNAIENICNFFDKKNISILNANSSRSGYRFATWNLHINFDYLVDKKLHYDKKKHIFKEMIIETDNLLKEIKKECSSSLFKDTKDIDLKDPIVIHKNTALPYFYQKSKENQKKDTLLYSSFSLRCKGNQIYSVTGEGGKLETILYRLNNKSPIYPSLIYSETDTNYLNLRLAIIPKKLSNSIFRVTIDYKRMGGNFSSKGMFQYILSKIPKDYNVWKFYNHTKEMTPFVEKGKVYLILIKEISIPEIEQEKIKLYKSLNLLNDSNNNFSNYFFSINIRPVSYNSIKQKFNSEIMKKNKFYYDLFISYSKENLTEAKEIYHRAQAFGLKPFLDKIDIRPGEIWEDSLRKAVNHSFEFCTLYTPICKKKEWVTTEWGAAWFLKKTITCITIDIPYSDLPDRLKQYQNVKFHQLESFLKTVKDRKDDYETTEFMAANKI